MDLLLAFHSPASENRRVAIPCDQALIGRDPQAEILLDHPSVSRRHATLHLGQDEASVTVEDRGSSNGTLVDGIPVSGRTRIHPDQLVGIGPYRFRVCCLPHPSTPPPPPLREEELVRRAAEMLPALVTREGIPASDREGFLAQHARRILYPRVLEILPSDADPAVAERITRQALTSALGLGPLESWLADPAVSEIMVNGCGQVFLERGGKLERAASVFTSEKELLRVLERILAPLGRRLDETTPFVDGRLPDGSRVNAVIPPISLMGPVVTIRKFPSRRLSMEELVKGGSISAEAAHLLGQAVREKRNILISGGTGTGKTTFLNILAGFIPPGERVVTIEDAAELNLPQEHVIRLETRPPNLEGRGAVSMRDLVHNSLRMRPDRIIVGECRGAEALDMLQAMNTGHEGSLTTCHANSPRDALKRIETLVLMAGLDLPHRAIRDQVIAAIQLVIQLSRLPDGRRVVGSIVELTGLEGEQYLSQELFRLQRTAEGRPSLASTGIVPAFLQRGRGQR